MYYFSLAKNPLIIAEKDNLCPSCRPPPTSFNQPLCAAFGDERAGEGAGPNQ